MGGNAVGEKNNQKKSIKYKIQLFAITGFL